ncbi:MAG: flagellar biosynthetic protein FliR [Burkholderiaceae bacterium]|nr:flagellar biosynthetic protein FliR [Burkholderiaceae bacterium]
MSVSIAASWLLAIALCCVRVGMVLVMTPLLGGAQLPARVRLFLVLAVAVVFSPQLNVGLLTASGDVPFIILMSVNEVIWGALMAFGLLCAFSAFMVAGRVLDLQIGFGLATLIDPMTRNSAPLLGVGLQMYGVVCFLAADGHHLVIRALARSWALIPLGASPSDIPFERVFQHFGVMFTLGVVMASAVMVVLFLVDVGMALGLRVLPQANVFLLSIPVKIVTGMCVLALSMQYLGPVMKKIFSHAINYLDAVTAHP